MNKIQSNVLLAPHTTFKIGGLARYFAEAESVAEIRELCLWAKNKNVPLFVLGGGSNVLVSDNGFGGLAIKIKNAKIKIQNDNSKFKTVTADAGVALAKLVSEASNAGLGGLEWAMGIPGTVGGAICGNAGAFGESISDNLTSVEVFDTNELRIKNYELRDCDFGYRDSVFRRASDLVILGAEFVFKKENTKTVRERIKEYTKQRKNSFKPVHNCAGCFFKNVEWKRKDIDKSALLEKFPELKQFSDKSKISTGFLIEFARLKGRKIGDAIVSNEHANFILNLGNARAEHVMMLASMAKQRIYNRYGFSLEEEVRLIGF